jgi:hypothetical protein
MYAGPDDSVQPAHPLFNTHSTYNQALLAALPERATAPPVWRDLIPGMDGARPA